MKGLLVSGGDRTDSFLIGKYSADSFIICADGGIKSFIGTGFVPDLLVGDLDSISEEGMKFVTENGIEIEKFPPVKDATDTEIALEILKQKGIREIVLLSATGTRIDHTLANIFLLEKLHNEGIKAKIVNERNEIFFADEGEYVIDKEEFKYLSVISLSDELRYSSMGLFYETDNTLIKRDSSLGVSNEILDEKAVVKINSGKGLIIKSKD